MPDALPRVGVGADVHSFSDAAPLYLVGLLWPGERGLAGHSDGDVAAHAACDALLSAAGLGDLGALFGTAQPRWEGARGTALLMRNGAIKLLLGNRRPLVHGDYTLILLRRSGGRWITTRQLIKIG